MTSLMPPQDYEAYIKKHEGWNFVVNTLDLTFYNLALSFIFSSTVLTLYASHLTTSAMLIGLIPAIQSVGYFLPQLLMARRSEQVWRKKPLVQKISVFERLPYLFVTLSILFWPQAPNWVSFTILATSLAMATFSGGLAGPAWNGMLAKVIRVERRGRFFGLSHALGGLLGIAGAAISRQVLATYSYPLSFGICFLFCFMAQVMSWIALSLNREPAQKPNSEARSARDYWRRLPSVLREKPNFTRYLISRALIILGGMAAPFYIIYARRAFHISDAFAANLTIAALISQTIATPLLGWLGDRRGHKWLTELSVLIGLGAVVLALVAPHEDWFYPIFVLMNAATSGLVVAGHAMVLEFGGSDVPTVTALASTLLAIPILLTPILGGWLADTLGFQSLFIVAMAFISAGWCTIHWIVREPRYERQSSVTS